MPAALESLLAPIDPIEFRERYYGKQPLLIQGRPGKFADLFTWEDLNRLLNASSYPHPNMVVTGTGDRGGAGTHTSIIDECRAGAALVVNQLQLYDRKVGELVRALEAESGEPIGVSLILSQPAQTAFAQHYDRKDVFVLHLEGHKGWSVYDRTVERPVMGMATKSAAPPTQPLMQFAMAPGDVLYIPRGHWHQALAQDGPSMHLSLVLAARTGLDFLAWLADELRSDLRFRHELPLSFADEPAEVREARLREHVARLGEALAPRFRDEETIQSFIRYSVLSDRDARRFKFPAQLFERPGAQLQVRHFSRPAHQRFVLTDEPADGRIALSVWGQTLRFPKSARPLVEFIVSQTTFALEDAQAHAGELTGEGIWDVLNPLLRDGILDAD